MVQHRTRVETEHLTEERRGPGSDSMETAAGCPAQGQGNPDCAALESRKRWGPLPFRVQGTWRRNTIIIIALLMVNDREVNLGVPSFPCDEPNPTQRPRAGGQAIARTAKPFRWMVSSKDCRKNKVEPQRSEKGDWLLQGAVVSKRMNRVDTRRSGQKRFAGRSVFGRLGGEANAMDFLEQWRMGDWMIKTKSTACY